MKTNQTKFYNIKPVGADSISARETTSTKTQRAEIDSAPTSNNNNVVDNNNLSLIGQQQGIAPTKTNDLQNLGIAPTKTTEKTKFPRRKSVRLKNYDYSSNGLYFITICTQNREYLFGEIENGKMILNLAGEIIVDVWNNLQNNFNNIKLHEFVTMPNHIHGIIEIVGSVSTPFQKNNNNKFSVGADSISAREYAISTKRAEIDSAPTIPKIIQTFKRYTTIEYIKMVKNNVLSPFQKRIWQRNYYEHIIRDEKSYFNISEYIQNNPLKWEFDSLNLTHTK